MADKGNTPDLFERQMQEKMGRRVYTVFEITQDIKIILENTFGEIWVEGELSNVRFSTSGHIYFSLKDERAILPAVAFSRAVSQIKFKLEDGIKVICFGNIEVYPPHGKYQLIVEQIEPKGIGSRQLALEQLKIKLEKEGLFSPAHKRPIPYLPSRIGIVTSLQGAAIKDMLKVLNTRFKDVQIIISPVKVQGEGAKEEIAQAIKDFNEFNESVDLKSRVEVLIVGRGGGSIEDLWAFNEEIVARAIYNSKIPVISAVGHERDWTIADLVADVRAATPSVAAELVVPKKEDLLSRVDELVGDCQRSLTQFLKEKEDFLSDLVHRFLLAMDHTLENKMDRLKTALKNLSLLNPQMILQRYSENLFVCVKGMHLRINHFLKLRQTEYQALVQKLNSLSPLTVLARGYSITFLEPMQSIVKDSIKVKIGDKIKTKLHKGEIESTVTEVKRDGGDKI